MNSQNNEKKPPISHKQLFLLYLIAGITLKFILGIFLDDFILEMTITLIVVLPIYFYFYFKYFHTPLRFGLSEKREGTQCPHHPEDKITTRCNICNIPICERCQDFKMEMRNYYQHNFRLNHKTFDKITCMDCILKKLEITSKILFILAPIGLSAGFGLILASFYVENWLFFMLIFLGILFSILGIVSIIGIFQFIPESRKIKRQFNTLK